ncbi:hypothetical protein [Pseudomonas veronii]|uniref:hypothetical protein n=1 Tax=Pseudomonas veronii TaxID=76761 RepID=UPI000F81621D|nr:hypothetical protein [Pseudomonas veronii]RTY75530.1 hypothetical protein EKA83_15680 [Pseudomonas veronii]
MSIEKCREEFEVWWSQDSQAELRSSCAKGWAGVVWQASREALVIDLPKVIGSLMYSSDVYEAIEAAGLKVKS